MIPETQLKAWEAIRDSGELGRLQWEAYDALCRKPGQTRNELDAGLSDRPNAGYSRRLVELERLGLVRRGDPRPCAITGHPSDTWHPTQACSITRPPKPLPVKQRIAGLLDELDAEIAAKRLVIPPAELAGLKRIVERAREVVR